MVLVAPVRTSSSTNQIHVTHTEDRKERKLEEEDEENPKELGKIDTAGLHFPNLFFFLSNIYIECQCKTALRYNQECLAFPFPRTHTPAQFVC